MLRNKEIKKLVIFLTAAGIIFAGVFFLIDIRVGIAFIAAFAFLCSVFYVFTRSRYKKLAKFSIDLYKIANGDLSLDIRDNSEGELSILQNEIYKLASKLTEQAAILKKEKISLSDSLSDISHQLKTPLSSLLIMSELLESKDLPPQKREEFSENIRIGLCRMEWLALSLLKMAKLDADTVILQRNSVEEIITRSIQTIEVIAASKNQHITFTGGKNIFISCDLNWTVEALSNIIKNSSEYSPENGEIKINQEENPLAVLITVEDSGTGIDEKDLPNLFRRFYKGAGAAKESAGIGLALSLAIMRKQNGDIEVKNKKEAGSVFVLKFYKTAVKR